MPTAELKLEAFREFAHDVAQQFHAKRFDKPDGVDELVAAATASGLSDIYENWAIEKVIGEAFTRAEGKAKAETHKSNGKADESAPVMVPIKLTPNIQPRDYVLEPVLARRTVGMLVGDGGAGKSTLLLQCATCSVLGQSFAGLLPSKGPVMYFTCEDEENEINSRLVPITRHYNTSHDALEKAGLRVYDYTGKDGKLGVVDRNDVVRPTPLYWVLLDEAKKIKPSFVIVDTVLNVFLGGMSNNMHVDTFMNLMRRLAIEANCAVLLIGHPSASGLKDGSGRSYSVAWHNLARLVGNFKLTDPKDRTSPRELSWIKVQYGLPPPDTIWAYQSGVYVQKKTDSLTQLKLNAEHDHIFLNLLARLNSERRYVAMGSGKNFAPVVFAKEPEAAGIGKPKLIIESLRSAMDRLYLAKKIELGWVKNTNRKQQQVLMPTLFNEPTELGEALAQELGDEYR